MLLSHYHAKTASRLRDMAFAPLEKPIGAHVLWFNAASDGDRARINYRKHRHTYFEAHFAFGGRLVYAFDDAVVTVPEGSGLLIAPGTPHTVKKTDEPYVKFSFSFLPDEEEDCRVSLSRRPHAVFPLSPVLTSAVESILSEVERGDGFSSALAGAHLTVILCETVRALGGASGARPVACDVDSRRIRVIKQFIADNPMLFLTNRDVADQFHFNAQYLSRLFKKETGRSLLDFIHEEKVKQAEAMLATTTLPMQTVAACLGFQNAYYFCAFFKRYEGITPGEYQKLRSLRNEK